MVRQLVPVDTQRPAPAATPPEPVVSRRIAVLCGGHSLVSVYNAEVATAFDLVFAVNGAAFLFPCDFAAMVDRPVVLKLVDSPKWHPRIALVTYQSPYAQLAKKLRQHGIETRQIPSLGKNIKSFTAPRAIVMALAMAGPQGELEIFGMDFSDEGNDCAGLRGDHGPLRWLQEADCFRRVWDRRIVAVHGRIRADRLAFIKGESPSWPG